MSLKSSLPSQSGMTRDRLTKTLTHGLKQFMRGSEFIGFFFIMIYQLRGRIPWSLGYSFYKFKAITALIEGNLGIFDKEQLPLGYAHGLDERAVEYPWFFSRLKDGECQLLDAGGTFNHLKILKLSLWNGRSLSILTLSPEWECRGRPRPTYVYEDLRKTSFEDDHFDAVACLSTLEHIGMDNTFLYTSDRAKKENDPEAYLEAVREFKRILKKGGTLYLTMPFGKKAHHRWFQIFDAPMVARIKDVFVPTVTREWYYKYAQGQWMVSDQASCQDAGYHDVHAGGMIREDRLAAAESVVCLELVK